jgi:putative Holliday junction resolvase
MGEKRRILGLDIGDKRTGVAASDPEGILASPLTVFTSKDEETRVKKILQLAEQCNAGCIVIGLPLRMDGATGTQASKITSFAEKLSSRAKQSGLSHIAIYLWDERLSTKAIERLKIEAHNQRNRLHPRRRGKPGDTMTDALAAAFILQGFLDSLKSRGQCPDS